MAFIPVKQFSVMATLKQNWKRIETNQPTNPQTRYRWFQTDRFEYIMLTLHQFSYNILYLGPVENYTSHKLALNKFWISLELVFKLKSCQYITCYCHFITPINPVWPEVERKWMLSSFAKGLSLTPGCENMTAVMNWKPKLLTKTSNSNKVEIFVPL